MLFLLLCILAAGCKKDAQTQPWEPKGFFDPSEVINNPKSNHFLLFDTGRVTHFLPDGSSVWMGVYEKTNGMWVWDVFANHWRIEPDGDRVLLVELGDPRNPLLRNPTNRAHLTPLPSVPARLQQGK